MQHQAKCQCARLQTFNIPVLELSVLPLAELDERQHLYSANYLILSSKNWIKIRLFSDYSNTRSRTNKHGFLHRP